MPRSASSTLQAGFLLSVASANSTLAAINKIKNTVESTAMA